MKGKVLNTAQLLVVFFFFHPRVTFRDMLFHLRQADVPLSKIDQIKKINSKPGAFSAVVLGPSSAHLCLFQNI